MTNYENVPFNRLEPNYLAGYGLQRPPFSDDFDHRALYLDSQRQTILEILSQLSQNKPLTLLVVGERGIGKSSLKHYFIDQLDERCLVSEVQAHPMMDANELLANLAQGFGLFDIPAAPAELHDNLYHYLGGLQQQNRVPIVVVDDAHELPQEALQALFYLADTENRDSSLLRMVLFCEPAIEVMLESPVIQPLREIITHSQNLVPFDETQTAEYIRHRLAVAGLEGTSPFSPGDIQWIYECSQGIPDRINKAADQFLAEGRVDELEHEEYAHDETNDIRAGISRRSIALGSLAALLLVSLILWWSSTGDERPEQVTLSLPVEQPSGTVGDEAQQPGTSVSPNASLQEDPVSSAPPAATSSTADDGQADQTVGVDEAEPEPASAPPLRVQRLEPNPVPASDHQQTLSLYGEGFDETTRITVEWGNERKTLLKSRVTPVDSGRLDFQITVGNTPQTWLLVARNPASGEEDQLQFQVKADESRSDANTKPAVKAAPVENRTGNSLDWLQRQPADHYTLQLLAGRQEENLRVFLERHKLDGQSVIFETRRGDQPWYAVAYGSYPDRASASRAAAALPGGIDPWIRRLGDVQQSLLLADATPVTDKPVPGSLADQDHAAWLWDQDPTHYTLQLIAGQNASAIRAFIQRHDLTGQAVFYETRRDGQPWYVVVFGNYADRQGALAAREQLPAALREQSPWPRPFSDIHADLDRR